LIDVRENTPVELFVGTSFVMMVVFGTGHYFLYKLFGSYAEKMLLHHMCLSEFKESPISKRVIDHLPPMDIIKEDNNDEDSDEETRIIQRKATEPGKPGTPPPVARLIKYSKEIE
jgi:hypothetical protein